MFGSIYLHHPITRVIHQRAEPDGIQPIMHLLKVGIECMHKGELWLSVSLLYTGWAKNETTLVCPIAATVQDKIKRISLKCSQSLQK